MLPLLSTCTRETLTQRGPQRVIAAFRVNGIRDRELFVCIDDNPADFTATCREGFGVDTAKRGIPHKFEWAETVEDWQQAKITAEVKTRVGAAARAHGVPFSLLSADWNSILDYVPQEDRHEVCVSKRPSRSISGEFRHQLIRGRRTPTRDQRGRGEAPGSQQARAIIHPHGVCNWTQH